jgi:ADP-ribose pyrophosphatase YjhB (NUDIX family)
MADYIDKLAFVELVDGKILSTMSKGKDTWYIPGGKREGNETDEQALIREVKEELNVDILPETIEQYGVFEAQAHGKPEGTVVRMTCYTAKFSGGPSASSEIEQIAYLGYNDKESTSAVDQLIFDDLHQKGLLK